MAFSFVSVVTNALRLRNFKSRVAASSGVSGFSLPGTGYNIDEKI